MYMPNQYSSQMLQTPQPTHFETSAFKPVNVWPHEQQYSPFYPFDTQQMPEHQSNGMENRYINRFDRNVNYDLHLPSNDISTVTASNFQGNSMSTDQKWQLKHNVEQMLSAQSITDYRADNTFATNSNINSSIDDVKPTTVNPHQTQITPIDTNNQNAYTDITNSETDTKKKIRRPMNSFMIYAKVNINE